MKKLVIGLVLVLALAVAAMVVLPMLTGDGGRPDRKAELQFISSDSLHTLDPHRSSWMVDFRILRGLFETLVLVNPETGDFEPGVAAVPGADDISADKRTYTFHLNPETRWSNGRPVTAEDFRFGWRRALMPDTASDYSYLLWYIEGAKDWYELRRRDLEAYAADEAGQSEAAAKALYEKHLAQFDEMVSLKAPDEHTLVVTLEKPIPYFLHVAAFPTLSPLHEPHMDGFKSGPDAATGRIRYDPTWIEPGNVVCNGPYILSEWNKQRDLLLTANKHYWNRDAVKSKSVHMKVNKDPGNAQLAMAQGDADWWADVPSTNLIAFELVTAARAGKRNDVSHYPVAGTYFLEFNCLDELEPGKPNPLAKKQVRQALSLAIDRQALVDTMIRGGQPVARTYVPPGFEGYRPAVEAGPTFDPQRARQLLAQAGHAGGKGMGGLRILIASERKGDQVMFQFVAEQWRTHLGIDVTADQKPSKLFGELRKTQQYAIARGNWFGDYPDPTTFLTKYLSDGNNNDAKWANERYDRLVEEADMELHPAKRMEMLRQAEALLLEEAPIAPLFRYVWVEMYDPERVKGLSQDILVRQRLDLIEVTPPSTD